NGGLQGHHDGMRRRAVVTAEQFVTPPLQQLKRVRPAARFVAEIIRPAAVRVNRMEMWQEPPRQKQRGDGEILVVRMGEAGTILPRPRGAPARTQSTGTKRRQLLRESIPHGGIIASSRL